VDFDKACEAILDMARVKTHRLLISGGEPLLREDIFELMELAHKKGLVLELYTNGLLVSKFEKRLRKIPFAQVDISIDGLPDSHDRYRGIEGSFERAIEALNIFKRMGVPIRRASTITYKRNLHELPELKRIIMKSDANAWILNVPNPIGRAEGQEEMDLGTREIRQVVDFTKKHCKEFKVELSENAGFLGNENYLLRQSLFFCQAGLSTCSIDPEGNVLGCFMFYDDRYSEGNIKNESFRHIWKNRFQRFRSPIHSQECLDCPDFHGCRGGCRAQRMWTGSTCWFKVLRGAEPY